MQISVLGPVEVSVGGRPVPIGAGKPRALLALLALHEGTTVSTVRLVEGLWGAQPPATAHKMVQLYVSQLRKALANGEDGGGIVTRGRGYELRLGDGGLDARDFEQLISGGMPREALVLWRGAPLADVADEPFAGGEIRRLEELRLQAIELAVDRDLAGGRHREVVGELEAAAAEEPLRERLHAQRMLALYRSGRQADALEAYRDFRGTLVEAIGAEPGPDLRHLHEAILRQDPELEPPGDDTAALPPELDVGTALVGREAELATLREHWRHAHGGAGRLVLVLGARGIGKTRLAAELAAELHRDRAIVLYASGAGAPETARAVVAAAHAARRPTLVVIDDLDRAGEALRRLLEDFAEPLQALPVLIVAATAPGAPVVRAGTTLTLAPLDADGVAAIARSYAHEETEVPIARLVEASGGVPQLVHRCASEWARSEAAQRLDAAARRAASDRTNLRTAEDDLASTVVERQAARERDDVERGADGIVVCPFKGLASFDVDDSGFFFGRERLVAEMVARLVGAPLIGIVGPSGSGKSSALRAGLLPALAEGVLPGSEGWTLNLLRPGDLPARALDTAIAAAGAGARLVVAVDQFEEIFTACGDEAERVAFVDALVECTRDARRRTLVLVAIRADFYGRCASYPELWRLLGANQVTVGPMRREELRRAIELPARRAGLEVDPDLTDALVGDVEGEPGALPLMSTALLELWQRRAGRRLRLAAYEQVGGVDGAVARLAESTYGRLDPAQQAIARRILLRLAGEGEGDAVVRRRVGFEELPGEGVAEVLDALADDRLVTVSEGTVEVAHEALLREWPRLRGWLDEDAQGRRAHRELGTAARAWDAGGRDSGELYRGARLAAALDWSATHEADLSPAERAFLDQSRATSERSQRRLRAGLVGVAALLVLAVIAGAVAVDQRGNARDKAVAADAQRLGARGLLENDLDTSLLLARQGVALNDSVQTRGSLLAALGKSPAAIGVMRGDGERMWELALSPDERTLAAGDPAGNVFLFDTRTHRRVATVRPTTGIAWITKLTYSPDGSRLAIAHDTPTRGNAVAVLDTSSRRVLRTFTPPRPGFVTAMRFTGDDTIELTTVANQDFESKPAHFMRYDARTGRRLLGPIVLNRRAYSPLLATSDGRRLITAGDGEVVVRDAATLRVRRRYPVAGETEPRWATGFALSPDDRTLSIGERDGTVRLLDLQTGAVRTASGRHDDGVGAAQFTLDGRTLVTGSEDDDVIVWDVRQAAAGETLSGHSSGVESLRLTRNGRTAYTAGLDGRVFIWDLAGRRRLGRPFRAGAGGDAFAGAVSSDSRLFARGQEDGAITLTDTRTLAPRTPFRVGGSGQSMRLRFVPGSRLMVVGRERGFLALVDSDSGRVLQRLRGHRGRVYTPAISADGRLLATGGGDDRTVRFWSLPAGQALGAPLRFRRQLYEAQLSPDGRSLVVSLIDKNFESGTVEVWDVRSRRRVESVRLAAFAGFTRFSPDGRLLAVGNRFGKTQVWSTASWKPVTRWLGGDGGGILIGHISPDGRTLATGSEIGNVQLWDIPTEQALGAPLPGGTNVPVLPFFTADGNALIASYQTGRAITWDIRPESLTRHACKVAGRRLTRAEWQEFLPGRAYDPAC